MPTRLEQQIDALQKQRGAAARQALVTSRAKYREVLSRYAAPHGDDARTMADEVLPVLKLTIADVQSDIKALVALSGSDERIEAEGRAAADATAKANAMQSQIDKLDHPNISSGVRRDLARQQKELRETAEEHATKWRKLKDFDITTRRDTPRVFSAMWLSSGK